MTQRREGYSLEIANLNPGDTRVLLNNLKQAGELMYADNLLTLTWQKGKSAGLSAYHPDGENAYTLALAAEFIHPENLRIFFSPDARIAAVKTGRRLDAVVAASGHRAGRRCLAHLRLGWQLPGPHMAVVRLSVIRLRPACESIQDRAPGCGGAQTG